LNLEESTLTQMQTLIKELGYQKRALDESSIVAATDRTGSITYVNEKFTQISGYEAHELLGQNHRLLRSGYHDLAFYQQMWETISAGQIWKGEICNRKKNGETYWVQTTIVPFIGQDGRPYQYLSIRYDITDLKQAQEMILEQQEKMIATSKLSALGELSAALTHEINNPLGVILGRCEMLQEMIEAKDWNQEELRKLAGMIHKTGQRIEKIIRSMRAFTHSPVDSEGLGLAASEDVVVRDLIEQVLDLAQQRLRNHGIELRYQPPPVNLRLVCRANEILQILVNLVNNAHDAIEEGTSPRWIELQVNEVDPNWLEFRVTDSGGGIPAAVRPKIFQPFFTTKNVQYGTGLGLPISKRLAEKHRGSLDLDLNAKHTSFVLRLPRS